MRFSSIATFAMALATYGQAKENHFADRFRGFVDDLTDKVHVYIEENQDEIDQFGEQVDQIVGDLHDARDRFHSKINAFKDDANITMTLFDTLAAHQGLESLPTLDTTCITLHCSGKIKAVLNDEVARENIICAAPPCAFDYQCTLNCSESYRSPVVDDLFQCLYVDHQCVKLPPPDALNNATCRNPTQIVETVDEDLLNGVWYAVQGFNPYYDCYDCYELTFEVTDGKLSYDYLFNMIAVNGTEIWLTDELVGEDRSQPGKLILEGHDNGMTDDQTWFIMHLDEDTLVAYYCANLIDQYHWEGLYIASRTPTLNPEKQANVAQILADLGITEDQLCTLKPQECDASPSTPGFWTQ